MAGGWQEVKMLIYPEDKEFIRKSTLNYPNIETGGDLFGLWRNESEVVVQLVTGPGKNCRRTQTAFFQDKTYLSYVGERLTEDKGLCNIGEWHSHHRLNLPEPSAGDRATVFRHMPGCGLKRFLLIIATITPTGQVNINGYMFTAPERGNGRMRHVQTRALNGLNPFRNHPDLVAMLSEGAETSLVPPSPDIPPVLDENDGTANTELQQPRRRAFSKRSFKIWKPNKKDKQKKEKEKHSQPTENPDGKAKSRFWGGRKGYDLVPDGGGTSRHFSQSNNQSDPTPASDVSSNNIGDHYSPYDQTTSRAPLIQERNEYNHQGNHPSVSSVGYQKTSAV